MDNLTFIKGDKPEKGFAIPVPTEKDGYTKEQIKEWEIKSKIKAAEGKGFVGDY